MLSKQEIEIASLFQSINRRDEFISGRRCAQVALKQAGLPGIAVFRSSNRSPSWPLGAVGSITHGAGLAAAIVGKRRSGIMGVGLDIEDLSRAIKTNITRHVLTPWEIDHWLGGREVLCREVRTIFSIKEAIYKCLYPLNSVYLGFHDADVLEMSDHAFEARVMKSPLGDSAGESLLLSGRVMISGSVILSATSIKASELLGSPWG